MKYKIGTVYTIQRTNVFKWDITINSFTRIIINEIMVMKLVGFIVTLFPLYRDHCKKKLFPSNIHEFLLLILFIILIVMYCSYEYYNLSRKRLNRC